MNYKKTFISIALTTILLGFTSAQAACSLSADGTTYTCSNEYIYTPGSVSVDGSVVDNVVISNTATAQNNGYGLYIANLFGNAHFKNLDITTTGAQADGIMTRHAGPNPSPVVRIDKLSIKVSGASADGMNFGEEDTTRYIIVGDDAYISSRQGTAVRVNLALNAGVNSQVEFGDRLEIITNGNGSHSEDVLGYGLFAGIRNRVCGNFGTAVWRCGLGLDQWRDTPNQGNALITVGNESEITTTGNNAHAVYAMRGGNIALGSTNITTNNASSYGIYAETLKNRGGEVYLLGDVKITVPTGGYAIKADGLGSFISSKSRGDANGISQTKGGKFDIVGNINATSGGTVDLIAYDQSKFIGNLEATGIDSLVKLDVGASSHFTGNLNALNDSVIDLSFKDDSTLIGYSSKDETSEININLIGNNSYWHMTDHSTVTNLDLQNNAHVRLYGEDNTAISSLPSYVGSLLTIDQLTGNGTFWFKSNMETAVTDFLTVENVTGTHKVEVQNDGAQATNGTETLALINAKNVDNDDESFYMERLVELGGYKYRFVRNPDNLEEWLLVPNPIDPLKPTDPTDPTSPVSPIGPILPPSSGGTAITSTANAAASNIMTTYLVNFIETQNLLKRMGELKEGNDNSVGLWGRVYAGNIDSFSGGLLSGFKMNYHAIQLGADYRLPLDKAQIYFGGAFSYLDGSPKQNYKNNGGFSGNYGMDDRHSRGKIKSYSASLYGIYKTDDHLYIDGLIKYSHMKNSFSVTDTAGSMVSANANSNAVSISGEIGKRFYFDAERNSGMYVTPQAQITYSSIGSATYKASNGLVVKIDKRKSVLGRVGAELGYKFKDDQDISGNVFTKVSYLREFSNDGTYFLNNSRQKHSFKGNWYQMEIGANINFKKRHNIYANVEFNKGNKFNQKQLNIGYRYEF